MFSHLQIDLHEAWAAVTFARPGWLFLLALLPILGLLGWWSARQGRRALARIGFAGTVAGLRTPAIGGRRMAGLALPFSWAFLCLALAGPRWGKSDDSSVAVGRDLVIVLDMSRSMLADDMSQPPTARCDSAKAAVHDLLDAVARRGGHRVGLVVFAARPKVLCPLTTDSDQIKAVVADLDGRYPPPECRPGVDPAIVSGTRIGAALAAAVELHDPRFLGAQDIVLFSDGDDPVDDREWQRGADSARKAGVPVHVVGLGDPDRDSPIPVDDGFLDFNPKDGGPVETVQTRLHEDLLRAVANETRGCYLSARRSRPNMGEFDRTRIEPSQTREVTDDAIPQPKERFVWFLLPALALFAIGWIRGN